MSSLYVAQPGDGCVWITGASSGIGRALALSFARDGWTIAATARSSDKLHSLSEDAQALPGTIHAYVGDVTQCEDMASLVEHIGRDIGPIALLVANAGVYLPQDGLAGDLKAWQQTIDVNLSGTVNVVLPVIAAMQTAGQGQIAIVSSVAGYRGLPTSAAYGATKAALINMAEALKFDLDRVGLRIQVINPGFVDTPATADNPFPMPHLISVEEAAGEIRKGLVHPSAFEIAFPKAFVRQLKLLRILPYWLYFKLISKSTGWSKKT
ncbi:SDR family NAD(P)-dependent oxidoreductase [Roseibium algae]|uniref:SDR family NAD(P)-dependent oxidoreductase n=1 Tax=Roseibium algae TaxID=3123038 RepID=A0ABU8TJN9_9HYPH